MKKIPEIFKPKIQGKITNNREVYCSFLEEDEKRNPNRFQKEHRKSMESPLDTLMRLSQNGSYIFNQPVMIKTASKTYHTKIAGKMNDSLITLDKDVILLDDILAIEEE